MSASDPITSPPWGWGRTGAGLLLMAVLLFWVWQSQRPTAKSDPQVVAPWATSSARDAARQDILTQSIQANLDLPLTAEHDGRWQQFLNAAKWQAMRTPEVLAAVKRRLTLPPLPANAPRQVETARLALETAYALFPTELEPEMRRIFLTDTDPKRTAMAGAWLGRFQPGGDHRAALAAALIRRFPDAEAEPRLLALLTELRQPRRHIIGSRPPLADLLKAPFDGRPVVFSFQRVNRSWLGRAVVRHASGSFLVEADGRPFSVTQFARSASDLPGTLTNGNTPCGLFEIVKINQARNRAIGPSEALILGLPLEYDPSWTLERYLALWPASWQNWWPAREAWWAGQAGRNEILAHGTTIDPRPWQDTIFAGQTPSHGCLTCDESWDPATGHRTSSGQAKLTDAFRKAGGVPGYLVVVEVDDQSGPVTEVEVAALLQPQQS